MGWGEGGTVLGLRRLGVGSVRLFENSLWLSPRCFLLLALFRSRGTVLILGDSCSPRLGNIKVVTRQGQREALAKLQEKTAQPWGAPGRGLRPRPPPSAGRAPAALAVYAEGCREMGGGDRRDQGVVNSLWEDVFPRAARPHCS